MKKTIAFLMFTFVCNIIFGQNIEEAKKWVSEGVDYHDKGDFEGAISKYDKALELDKDNLGALTEKAISLSSLKKYDESISYCQKAIATHPGDAQLKFVYVVYGNSCDALNKTDASIAVYDEGIKLFPNYSHLYFNKGITLASVKKNDEAILNFQKAVILDPQHASSHNALAILSGLNNQKIPSLLAYCRLLSLDPQSDRAKSVLLKVKEIMKGNVEKTGKKSVTINISQDMLGDTITNGKTKENNFSTTELILSMASAMDFEKKNSKLSEVDQFQRKFGMFCSTLKEQKLKNYGFYWDYYVPYFIEMQEKKFVETFSYIAFATSNDKKVTKWLKEHENDIDKFFAWSEAFEWKTN